MPPDELFQVRHIIFRLLIRCKGRIIVVQEAFEGGRDPWRSPSTFLAPGRTTFKLHQAAQNLIITPSPKRVLQARLLFLGTSTYTTPENNRIH